MLGAIAHLLAVPILAAQLGGGAIGGGSGGGGSGVSLTGGDTIDNDADEVGLTVKGHSTQTSCLIAGAQDDDDEVFCLANDGDLTLGNTNEASAVTLTSETPAGTTAWVVDDNQSSGTANIMDWKRNATTVLVMDNAGHLWAPSGNAWNVGSSAASTGPLITFNVFGEGRAQFHNRRSISATTGAVWEFTHVTGSMTASSGTQIYTSFLPRINTSSTAVWHGLHLDATIVAEGGTDNKLMHLAVGGAEQLSITKGGDIRSVQATAPTCTENTTQLNAGAGSGATCAVTAGSTDMAGSLSITAGNGTPTAGAIVTLDFDGTKEAAPKAVILTAKDADGSDRDEYVSSTSTTAFEISVLQALAASEVVEYYFMVIE